MSQVGQRPPLRVALLGCGRAMIEEHLSVFRAHPALFSVVAACDLLKERRDIVAESFPNCRMFRQYDDMLDEKDIDVVDIASCSLDHVKDAMASLKRGFWTLVESPVSLATEDIPFLRAQAVKSSNRLMVMERGMFSPDYLLARQAVLDPRLGEILEISVRRADFIRRDDWQTVKRLGGGAAYYAMPDLLVQALKLMPLPPVQMWSELKRIASLGDSEDYCKVDFKTRGLLTAEVVFDGGALPGDEKPSFVIRGDRGTFTVMPGRPHGTLRAIDPAFKFPRRRSSVRTPEFGDMHETFPIVEETLSLPAGTPTGPSAFWRHVYDTVRIARPFPLPYEEAFEAIRYVELMKKTSPYRR